ncbi:MAG: hypothetical protein VZR09_03470 [Candidatus Gastranaerophilaceae bacterium]|jgi:hypothetical protein|nr:hypothetical protein [Candidatus Gastranaerophilaceae bacterium]
MQTISNATVAIKEIWNIQHPIIHKWFLFSALSMCVLFVLLFLAV